MPTPNFGLTKPTVGGDNNTWGEELNADLDLIDSLVAPLSAVSTETARAEAAEALLASAIAALPSGLEKTANKDQANGYAGLDSSGLLKAAEIPLNLLIPASGGGLPLIKSLKVGAVINQALASGDNLLYTVPSGKRAIFGGTVTNFSGGAITVNEYVRISGTDFHMGASAPATSLANNSTTVITVGNTYPIMEAGDVVNFNVSGAGLQGFFFAMIFDVTEGLKSPRLLTLASGDNTVYTCPSGKIAFLMNNTLGNAPIRMINKSGGSRTITWNVVPFGGSPATANKLAVAATVTNNTVNNQALAAVALAAGDFLSVNSDSSASGQIAYALEVVEIAA